MASKSEKLSAKIAAMEKAIAEAKREEAEAADRELLDLVHRAGCQREAIAFAERELARKKAGRASRKAAQAV